MNNPADTLAALAPCPFCGEAENLLVEHMEGTIIHPAYRVRCDNCGASSAYTDPDHIAAWNRRASLKGEAGKWYCPVCDLVLLPRAVTFEETHDERVGGCGNRVTPITTPTPPQQASTETVAALEYTRGRIDGWEAATQPQQAPAPSPAPQGGGDEKWCSACGDGADRTCERCEGMFATPPDPQADKDLMQRTVDKVVSKVMGQREETLQAFVAKYGFQPDEAVQVVGADGSWRVMRRQDMSTPSPAPQGGGEGPEYPDGCSLEGFVGGCERMGCHRSLRDCAEALSLAVCQAAANGAIDPDHPDTDAVVAAGVALSEAINSTPPAQQPGEVGGVRVTHQMILRAQAAVPSRGNAPAIYYSETQAILEAALAPKEKGNGPA